MPDPKLQQLSATIEEILQANDVVGVVHLVSKTHSEYLIHLSSSWSHITMNKETRVIRCKALRKDFNSPEEHNEAVAQMLGTILGLVTAGKTTAEQLEKLAMVIGHKLECVEHKEFSEPRDSFKIE